MNEVTTTVAEQPKQVPWTKHHQGAIAILGAVLATTSYFGKDYALARWNDRASSIKAARSNDDAVDNTTTLDRRIGGLADDLGILVDDALAIEQHKAPHAQSDRLDSTRAASLSSRSGSVIMTLRKCQERLKSLGVLDGATDPNSGHREELKLLLQDVEKKLAISSKASIGYIIDSNPSIFPSSTISPSQQEAHNNEMELLERQTDKIEGRIFELATIVRDDAEKQRARYVVYGQRTTVVLSVVFVLGLLLSLVGKFSGGGS